MDRFYFFERNSVLNIVSKAANFLRTIGLGKTNSHLSFVIHGAGLVFILRIVGYAFSYISQLTIARWIGQFEFGIYAYVWTWIKVLAVLGTLGMDQIILRFIPQYIAQKRWDYAAGMAKYGWRIVILGSILLTSLAVLIILLFNNHIYSYYITPLFVSLWAIPLISVIVIRRDLARAIGRPLYAYLPRMVLFPFVMIMISLFLMILGVKSTATGILWIVSAVLLVIVLFQHLIIKRVLPKNLLDAQPKGEFRLWLRVAFPILLMAGFKVGLTNMGVLILGIYLIPEDIAVYFAAERISDLVNFVLVAVNALGAPKIASLYAQQKKDALQKFVTGAARWIFWSSFLCAIMLILLGKYLLVMFGASFAFGNNILIVLIIGQLVNASAGPVGYMLVMTGHQDNAAWLFGGTTTLNIILNLILIPNFGAIGAAYAALISLAVRNIIAFLMVRQLTGIYSLPFFCTTR